ncbi:acetyl esterase [Ustulina deusta]|nr:acetyl esterase [Ustulina deusta]
MPLTSDIVIDYSRFDPGNTTEDTKKYSVFLEEATNSVPRWYDVGAPCFREMMEAGEFGGLKPVTLPEAEEFSVPSREPGRAIPVRMYKPDNGAPSKGILLHMHGGGYTLGSHRHADGLLKFYANTCQITAMSVGYRLAPEHPWPAGREDCIDVAEHLVDGGGGSSSSSNALLFLAGESGGANLAVLTAFALMRSRPGHALKGLVLPYGNYSVALGLPSMASYERPVVLNREIMGRFAEVYTPGWTTEARQSPLVSPLFEDLRALASSSSPSAAPGGRLPPALFLCGTDDPLLDDTLLMGVKWLASGSEAVVKIFPGAPHVFNVPDLDVGKESFAYEAEFLLGKINE